MRPQNEEAHTGHFSLEQLSLTFILSSYTAKQATASLLRCMDSPVEMEKEAPWGAYPYMKENEITQDTYTSPIFPNSPLTPCKGYLFHSYPERITGLQLLKTLLFH